MEIEHNVFFRAERLCTLLLCRQTKQKNVHGASLQVPGWGEGGLPEGGGTHRFLVHATTLPAPFTFPQIGALHPIQSLARREGGLLDLPAAYTGGTFSVHFRGGTALCTAKRCTSEPWIVSKVFRQGHNRSWLKRIQHTNNSWRHRYWRCSSPKREQVRRLLEVKTRGITRYRCEWGGVCMNTQGALGRAEINR